jgi:ABC-type polar amino acid transport system ATPase subunit
MVEPLPGCPSALPLDSPGIVFSWKGLTVEAPGSEPLAVPDLEIKAGQSVLACHYDDRILTALARLSTGLEVPHGEVLWSGAGKPDPWDFEGNLRFYRRIAHVGPESQLLSNATLLGNLCFELEYNQEAFDVEARNSAMECLESLGLTPLATLDPNKLVGQTRYVSLMALAVSRRPTFFVFERPMALLKPLLFNRVFHALMKNAADLGQAVLILGRRSSAYPEDVFDLVHHLGEHPNQAGTSADETSILHG